MYKTLFTKERGNRINYKMISNRMNYSSFLYINEKFKLCCCNSITCKRLNHKCCCNIIFSIAVNSFFYLFGNNSEYDVLYLSTSFVIIFETQFGCPGNLKYHILKKGSGNHRRCNLCILCLL